MGIQDVYILEDLSAEGVEDLLGMASVIWLSEGSPKLLMQSLAANNLASFVPRLNDRGAIIGGAGRVAGALGIGYIEGNITPPVMTSLSVMPNRGMGLWNGFVIPCFDEDDRLAAGLSACLDQPNRPCLAINHGSIVRINGDDMNFWGPGTAILIDGRKAKVRGNEAKAAIGIQDVKLHAFTEGDTFAWFQ
jgi:cyanophycinase-like exopeptidase